MPHRHGSVAQLERSNDEARILAEEIQERIGHISESVAVFLTQHPDDLNRVNRLNETLYYLSEELDEEIQALFAWDRRSRC